MGIGRERGDWGLPWVEQAKRATRKAQRQPSQRATEQVTKNRKAQLICVARAAVATRLEILGTCTAKTCRAPLACPWGSRYLELN